MVRVGTFSTSIPLTVDCGPKSVEQYPLVHGDVVRFQVSLAICTKHALK